MWHDAKPEAPFELTLLSGKSSVWWHLDSGHLLS